MRMDKEKILHKKLKEEIYESKETVEKVKRGFSAFDLEAIQKAQQSQFESTVIK